MTDPADVGAARGERIAKWLARAGVEPDAPVAEDGEDDGTGEEVGERHERIGEDVRAGAVLPVQTLADEDLALFKEGGNTGDRHKAEEGDGEEVDRKAVVLREAAT